ncbi:WecB/TagA/CpsF family glycosyltransferase [Methylobacter sp. S3L5C]|uniref:WecB/TagA/CpsF family glycosyltransferase n=1 Tax=Methylobacter sp. S3L5C TaxID=2839024 RepID=UPI001FAE5599|nr:WecB/TagA/CpsF family glycosyltransferase [Methylobacter sp. S3L5C]UOA09136.1 WecB/TagA/CpsF family glycosyltransferase [Methylobacter sp. S3L5C]
MSKLITTIPGPLGQRPRPTILRLLRPWLFLVQSALPRIFDVVTSLLLLLLLLPLLLLRGFIAYSQTGLAFNRQIQIGRFQQQFERLSFAGYLPGQQLAVLLNVLRGDLAWAGPRPVSPEELSALSVNALFRFGVRPGVISPYALRKKIGLAYDDERVTDHEFYYSATAKEHIGLSLRGVVGSLLTGNQPRPTPPILHFWGVDIVNTSMAEALDWIEQRILQKQKALLAFVNPACLNIAYTHTEYRDVLQTVERVLPDGIGINIGCRLLNESLLANINGTDLFPRLCERAAKSGYSLFLLGGLPGIAELTAQAMQERYPNLLIAGVHDGYFSSEQESQVIETINKSGAALLLVGFGVPQQELWLARHREQLLPTVCFGIGGLFDYYSGRIPRAPVWMREIGLEWTWRLLQEPGRMWKRYLIGNPLFLYRVWLQRQQGSKL